MRAAALALAAVFVGPLPGLADAGSAGSEDFVAIPGGRFEMGDALGVGAADERPAHAVTVAPFELARREVTRADFARFVAATGYRTDAERDVGEPGCYVLDLTTGGAGYRAGHDWRNPGFAQTDDHPVVCVSWNDAQAYVEWLNRTAKKPLRLPSEAEWEFAVRAGSTARFPWGDDPAEACLYANVADRTAWPAGPGKWKAVVECFDGYFFTAPVGTYRPNAHGLHDLIGNVWEWTFDCWNPDYAGAPSTGDARRDGDCTRRANRGSSWANTPDELHSSNRYSNRAAQRYVRLGFRLARDP